MAAPIINNDDEPILHHHHSIVNDFPREHDHSPAAHDHDGRHNDGAFDDTDILFGPAHFDHDHP